MPNRRANISITWTSSEKEALILAIMGYQIKSIAAKTSLTTGQVYYRLKKLNLSDMRRQYKTMDSPIAKRIINTNKNYAMQYVQHQIVDLRKQVTKPPPRSRKAA